MDVCFISESFALNCYIFVALTIKKMLLILQCKLKQSFLFVPEELIEYRAFAFNAVLSNLCVCPLPRIKMSFFLLPICTVELISTPKIMSFFPQSKFGSRKSERESNPVP